MQFKKHPMTVQEHIDLGTKLVAAKRALEDVVMRLPKTSRAGQAARRCLNDLVTVRSCLDDDICALTARCDPRNLAIQVYYNGVIPDTDPAAPGDVFAGWKEVQP